MNNEQTKVNYNWQMEDEGTLEYRRLTHEHMAKLKKVITDMPLSDPVTVIKVKEHMKNMPIYDPVMKYLEMPEKFPNNADDEREAEQTKSMSIGGNFEPVHFTKFQNHEKYLPEVKRPDLFYYDAMPLVSTIDNRFNKFQLFEYWKEGEEFKEQELEIVAIGVTGCCDVIPMVYDSDSGRVVPVKCNDVKTGYLRVLYHHSCDLDKVKTMVEERLNEYYSLSYDALRKKVYENMKKKY
jgi:hypothetical protein